MTIRTYSARDRGAVTLDIRINVGSVRLIVEDRNYAEVVLTCPDGNDAAARAVQRTTIEEYDDYLTVRVPNLEPTTVRQHFDGVTQVVGHNVGVVVGVVYGSIVTGVGGAVIGGMTAGGIGPGVDIAVRLPLGSSLIAETISASVDTSGALVRAVTESVSGSVHLDTVAAPDLSTISGRITIDHLIGDGYAKTTSGAITAAATDRCHLRAESVAGSIRVTGPINLSAHTVSGRVTTS
ncbi:hypothetical protein GCM10010399_32180 [Dactylosporangium fulvum]|uniref:Adhesin domain-containing protein n=1 Tax=Dactylosporangium fulvum TaxID=53359 RepID=A0ABY5W3U2_9ACTN|nr:hypothetical protein [Dactylosporangium fulvum]UWP83914.1 hypothetical protein Dfulv_06575 [Dactylosporangium fulvum]